MFIRKGNANKTAKSIQDEARERIEQRHKKEHKTAEATGWTYLWDFVANGWSPSREVPPELQQGSPEEAVKAVDKHIYEEVSGQTYDDDPEDADFINLTWAGTISNGSTWGVGNVYRGPIIYAWGGDDSTGDYMSDVGAILTSDPQELESLGLPNTGDEVQDVITYLKSV